MQGSFKHDFSKFYRGVKALAVLPKSKEMKDVMIMATGQVVRRVVDITPPSKGKANGASKKRGEAAILSDLARVMETPLARDDKAAREINVQINRILRMPDDHQPKKRAQKPRKIEDPFEVYEQTRNPNTGRINRRFTRKRLVEKTALDKLKKQLLALVGTLAAGWNKCAEKLGVKLPAWIRRHGNKYGVVMIQVRENGIRITIGNDVPFVDNISDLPRRLQWALDVVGKNILKKQVPAIMRRSGKKAGFKG